MIAYNAKDASRCLPAGDYEATMSACTETTSQKGNDMHKITWAIPVGDGTKNILIFDYIAYPAMTWKLGKIAKAFGKTREFEANRFDPCNLVGSSLRLTLKVRKQDGFEDKNEAADYKPFSSEKVSPMVKKLRGKIDAASEDQEPVFVDDEVHADAPF